MKTSKASRELSVNLFRDRKEYLYFFLAISIIFSTSIFIKYLEYKNFTKFTISESRLFVENQYPKKDYFVFKLVTEDNFRFYSISKDRIKNLKGLYIQADIKIREDFNFQNYLSGDFLFIRNISLLSKEKIRRYILADKLDEVHQNSKISELYSALFLATPIGKELREDLSRLGISHLAVLSGFHVSFIIGVIFLISLFSYRFIQRAFFPYRNFYRDTAIFAIFIIVGYLIFLGTPSSFLRAVTMFIIGFLIFDRNILKARFEVLLLAVILLIAFQPTLIFSVGFWFSVSGVFYILLYMKYFSFGVKLDLILINIWVFIAMIPIVHYIFPYFSFQQLLSPIWTVLFSIFYPLSGFIHILGFGNIFDKYLVEFLNLDFGKEYQFLTPNWFIFLYLSTSIGFALKRR